MTHHTITIDAGQIRFLYDDDLVDLLGLGKAETRRASHVEPVPGGWTADMGPAGGPVLGPYPLRQQALDAEREWLGERGF